ncbi:protein rogdi isoform X1 [Planococcus citri]|uniref:protein rogdi isoform X1 n=1 Tax=Planococcus citri TaxID=170843 RepID=UPI0031F8B70F
MQTSKIVDLENEEAVCLQKEFEWILTEEVHAVLNQLHIILVECVRRFPLPLYGNDSANSFKQEKYVLTSPPDQLKTVISVNGDSIAHADIQFRVQRPHQQPIVYRTYIQNEHPWKLQQLQDAGNHVQEALLHIDNIEKRCSFCSSEEVLHILAKILGCLQRGRTCLIVPRKKPMEEIIKSGNMKCLFPTLPDDVAITFYVQSHKLILAVYQSSTMRGSTTKCDAYQAECTIPWLNEVLVLFTVALQLCQQLKDKICVFAQYKDFTIESRPRRRSSVSVRMVDKF